MLSWKKKLLIYLCSLLPIIAVAAWSVVDQVLNNYVISLDLNGESAVCLEYGETYQEAGAVATSRGLYFDEADRSVQVKILGDVDTSVLGTYEIKYVAKYKNANETVVRTVSVADTTPPDITLTTNPDAYTLPGQPYEEEGYAATDIVDGDVTALVERKEEDGKVYYTVTDAAGNSATAIREINYHDPIPPELTLKGSTSIAMTGGKSYKVPGYSAQDNCDGDITSKVKISGHVDGNVPGVYTLKYSVEDSYGNVATATRTVTVAPHPVQESVENPNKVIYLTFDDGPGPYTQELLSILKEYNVKATFFVVNRSNISVIKQMAADGHTVAIHSASHNFKSIYASEDAYFADLYKMQGIIKNLTGEVSMLVRFPGGSSNTISSFNEGIMTRLTAQLNELGFRYFDWNVDSNDAGGATTREQVVANVIAGVSKRNMSVVLQHDIKKFSVDAVAEIITWGLENGYTFLPLTENSPACEHSVSN